MIEDIQSKGLSKEEITELLIKLGNFYSFILGTEVNTGHFSSCKVMCLFYVNVFNFFQGFFCS